MVITVSLESLYRLWPSNIYHMISDLLVGVVYIGRLHHKPQAASA
jgi:hypothetical protein